MHWMWPVVISLVTIITTFFVVWVAIQPEEVTGKTLTTPWVTVEGTR